MLWLGSGREAIRINSWSVSGVVADILWRAFGTALLCEALAVHDFRPAGQSLRRPVVDPLESRTQSRALVCRSLDFWENSCGKPVDILIEMLTNLRKTNAGTVGRAPQSPCAAMRAVETSLKPGIFAHGWPSTGILASLYFDSQIGTNLSVFADATVGT
jgi:hypothetical protein